MLYEPALRFAQRHTPRPEPTGLDVTSSLRHFSIVSWAVPPERYPPLPRRPDLENRLAALLGTGFGLGVTLTAGRLVADLGPPWAPAGVLCCSAAGLALACWVVRTRRLLAERAALDRWVGELTAALSIAVQERLAARLVAVSAADAAGFRGGGRPR